MATIRNIRGAWVYDYRFFGARKRIKIGLVAKMTIEEARLATAVHDETLTQAHIRQRAWQNAQSFSGKEPRADEGGLLVVRRNISELAKNARKNAIRKGMVYDLSKNDILAIVEESRGRCCISGIPFSDTKANEHKCPFMPSIDRINSSGGYTYDNCRLVCFAVNSAMNEWGLPVLERVAMGMASHVPPFSTCR